MATLPSKTFAGFVQDLTTAWTSFLGFQPTLPLGDPFLALMETVAAQCVFLQALAQLVNNVARAQTSTGADLDSFYGQFGFLRHAGFAATGQVTFTKLTAAVNPINIAAGVIVQTIGGAIQYQVVADTNQPTWNASLNAYVLAIGQTSLTATVQALNVGAQYNVVGGQLAQFGTPVPGIDQVTNGTAIINGVSVETDAAYSARFVSYLNGLSKATQGAIFNAVQSVPGVVEENLVENVDPNGNPRPGEFVVAVDNGTGAPPASLVTAVQTAVNGVRAFTVLGVAQAVVPVTVPVSLSVRVASGFVAATVQTNVSAAVASFINQGNIGATTFISAVEAAALAVAGVVAVRPGTSINSLAADFVPATPLQAARTTANNVSCGTY